MTQISSIRKRTVVSCKPVQSGKTCQLSVLDRIMEKNNVRVVLYYKNPTKKDGQEITRKLTNSLGELLFNFPVITGRLGKMPEEQWMINCNDAGVRFVEAKAEGNVDEWLRNVNRDKELELLYWEEMFHKPYFWSTLYIQLTEFKQGGLAIGLSCSHLLADPICATMFVKAWTETTLGRTMTSPPVFHSLPQRRPANINQNHRHYYELINHYKNIITLSPALEAQCVTTITLEFSHQMVRACIDMHQGLALTPFEALTALFWVVISKVKESIKSGLVSMSICLDMRKVLGLDKGFFGNCMVYNKIDFASPLDHDELMVLEAGLAIKNVANKIDNEGIMDLVEWLESNNHQSTPLMSAHDFICVNLENVEAYDLSFDDELDKPIRASYYMEPVVGEGQLLILPSPESGEGSLSRLVMVTLPGHEVVKLCQEALFIKFSPTICMDPN